MKKVIAGCSVLLILIFFVSVESRGSTFLNNNDIDVTFRTTKMVRSRLNVAGVYSSRTGDTRQIEADYWDETMIFSCGPEVTAAPDDYVFKSVPYDNTDNSVVKELIEVYRPGSRKADGVFVYKGLKPYAFACHVERGVTALKYIIRKKVPDSTVTFGIPLVVQLMFFCIYDTSIDSMIYVDSLQLHGPEDKSSFDRSWFDSRGENFYFKKRDVVVRFNIDSGVLDSIVHGDMPLIPHNSDNILVYDNESATIKLLSEDETVRSSVAAVVTSPLTVYKVQDEVFLVGHMVHKVGSLHATYGGTAP